MFRENRRIVTLAERDAGPRQDIVHWRIDIVIDAADLVPGCTQQQRCVAHRRSGNPQEIDPHVRTEHERPDRASRDESQPARIERFACATRGVRPTFRSTMPCNANAISAGPDASERHAKPTATVRIDLVRHEPSGVVHDVRDDVAVEEPLELRIEGKSVAVLMRTPGHDEELVAGFLLSEGLVSARTDIFEINRCPSVAGEPSGNVIEVLLAHPETARLENLTRHVFSASSCGICGKSTIASVHQHFPPLEASTKSVAASILRDVPSQLLDRQESFRSTGGLHGAALVRTDGMLQVVREDVGRHNAVDKVLGRSLLDGALPATGMTLFVSGRISFEIVQKALAARIGVIAGVSAPTSLAVEFARASGQTLVGFVRDGRMNVYAGVLD
jgi:FdhD protein